MKIKLYHWNSLSTDLPKGISEHEILSRYNIDRTGNDDKVVVSVEQKRYYIPRTYNINQADSIMDILMNTKKLPDMGHTKYYEI